MSSLEPITPTEACDRASKISVPSALLLFVMLFAGLKHYRTFHITVGIVFAILWTGTFITGIFFLPHELP